MNIIEIAVLGIGIGFLTDWVSNRAKRHAERQQAAYDAWRQTQERAMVQQAVAEAIAALEARNLQLAQPPSPPPLPQPGPPVIWQARQANGNRQTP